jgi:EAL domain-containing protein (putative c-di-GMP-specific phosphodiesterase class I)
VAGAIVHLEALKQLGVRIAIDDFGTGYSSLSYLRQFPIDILKIDQSFIASLTTSSEAGAIIHTLVQLGKTLGIETVAEGIEHPGQLARLRDEDCETGQGFLYSRPLPAKDVPPFLEANRAQRSGAATSAV